MVTYTAGSLVIARPQGTAFGNESSGTLLPTRRLWKLDVYWMSRSVLTETVFVSLNTTACVGFVRICCNDIAPL